MIGVRVTTTERDEYGAAAKKSGVSLAEWVRDCCARVLRRNAK
jgi:hypothetical protein